MDRLLHFKDPAAGERQIHWRTAWDMFRERPVLGHGYSVFRVQSLEKMSAPWYRQRGEQVETTLAPNHAHNEFLQNFAETGLIGGALFLALCGGLLAAAARLSLRHPEGRWRRLGLAVTVGAVAFLFQNLFGLTFRFISSSMFFWLGLGLLVVAVGQLPGSRDGGPRVRRFRRWPWPAVALLTAALGAGLWQLSAAVMQPMLANIMVRLAVVEAERGHYQNAILFSKQTIDATPFSSDAYYRMACSYTELGMYPEAVAAGKKSLRLLPGDGSTYFSLGVAYERAGQLDQAVQSYTRAAELMPVPNNYIGLAQALAKQGRCAEAERAAEEAIAWQERVPEDSAQLSRLESALADVAAQGGDRERGAGRLAAGRSIGA